MEQGNNFVKSANAVPQANERLGWAYTNSTTNDTVFKEVYSYKLSAAIVLKNCIPEYRNLHPLQIVRLIKDNTDRGEQSDEEILLTKIDLSQNENASSEHLSTGEDLVFSVYTDERKDQLCLVTIDLEMQNKFTQSNPNIISRGVYYVAVELTKTVPGGNSSYSMIHKVYSIWLCTQKVVLSSMRTQDQLNEFCKEYNVSHPYKHRFGMRRFYDEIPSKVFNNNPEADLMEVVMFDLTVLQDKADSGQANEAEMALLKMIYDIPDAIKFIAQEYSIELMGYEEGVKQGMSLIERLEKKDEENAALKKELKEQEEKHKKELEEQKRENEELRRQIAQLQTS